MTDSSVPHELSWELLDRYYAGETTLDEQRRIQEYFASRPHAREALAALTRAVREPKVTTHGNAQDMLSAMHKRIARSSVIQKLSARRNDGRFDLAIAALLDVDEAGLSEQEIAELRQLIDAAKQDGR